MFNAITDVSGIEVGQAENRDALTGCTVIICREGAVVGVDVRGSAPGTRETDLCRPATLVDKAQAILLAGGSAFGLNAAAGVMRYLWERGIGYDVGVTKVPIVPGAVIFDLPLGQVAWPDEAMGYQACQTAGTGEVAQGCVGAGTGASVGKLFGPGQATKSGLGTASIRVGKAIVGALIVVNAFGDVVRPQDNTILAGTRHPLTGRFVNTAREVQKGSGQSILGATNTTIGVVATDADLSVEQANHLAKLAHDGLARTIRPVHTLFDGDTLFALATGKVKGEWHGEILALAAATVDAVERAVLNAVEYATAAGGLPAGKAP
ncbi:glutamate N-acetyltransferase [Acididesulfobacillus acetoxydans]|uniref:Glutamate N-acetyltransferase n=1 Tax=Acididesulfobacillus acetoxydans TaxID=1561005 RepID=A0A8S0W2B0_9FIRM|nr:P1 family peptidase [Acididesulfobacillus acetoxydans]CAA7600568.1 glutamate N-acetyltransferase [Acididesulfobacillus acetoxydans]CEJ06702.1 Peptidase S58 DmpA [Acididesulfobacillus acetoxydans]